MSVRELRHDRPSGRFSKSWGLSARVSFISSLSPPRSFTRAIFPAVFDSCSSFFALKPHRNACAIFPAIFDSCSSFFAPKPHRNACYAGYTVGKIMLRHFTKNMYGEYGECVKAVHKKVHLVKLRGKGCSICFRVRRQLLLLLKDIKFCMGTYLAAQ